MPDITMCLNKQCKKRKTCYRFVAKPDKYQSFADFKPNDKGKCADYWEFKDDYLSEPNSHQRTAK